MAKAQGIIGNFKGKVGNMVGYQLTDSNNKQTQGIRIYQPNVKNPKTSAQAEQRAKLAPINATYRALKMIIDRGNEGLPYGNKSRLAWLKMAFMAENMPWIEKGNQTGFPVGCVISKGSLPTFKCTVGAEELKLTDAQITDQSSMSTIGALSSLMLSHFPGLKAGDQVTIVGIANQAGAMVSRVESFVLDIESAEANNIFVAGDGCYSYQALGGLIAGTVILSREGNDGQHLRSTQTLVIDTDASEAAPYDATSKTAAIKSYMTSGAANTDWAEESID